MLSQSYDKKHKTSDETHSSATGLHTSTATGTFLKLLTDISIILHLIFRKVQRKWDSKHIWVKCRVFFSFFFLQSEQSTGLCLFLHGVKLLVYMFHFPSGRKRFLLSESVNPDFDWWHYSDTCQVPCFIIITQICILLICFLIPASSVCEIIPPTGKMTDSQPFANCTFEAN